MSSAIITAKQARAGYGSAAVAVTPATATSASATGIVRANGTPMPPSMSYLQAQEEAKRHKKLDDAWRWYTGDIHGQIRPEPGQPDVNVITNRTSTIVDAGVDFLYGKTVTLEVLQNGKPNKKAQEALDGCWGNDDRRMTLMSKLAQNGGIFGHCFAKIIPPNDDRTYCRIVPLDPAQVTVITDEDDCDEVRAYILDWTIGGVGTDQSALAQQLTIGKRQIICRLDPDDASGAEDNNDDYSYDKDATWEISNWLRGPNNTWYMAGEPIVWQHQWAPVVDWQNLPLANAHWGMSDIPGNVQHLNSVLNLTLSNINAIAKHHSFPWIYASGVGLGATIELAPGKITQLQAPEGKLAALEAHGDLPGLLNFAADLRSDMDEQSRVPSVATGRMRDLPKVTSGVAFQMMYGPLLAKNTHKQRLYGCGHEELSLRMLSLCGYGDGTGLDGWAINTHWPSPLPNDDQSTAQLVTAMSQVGVSKHALYSVLDLDYDQEQEYLKQEAQDALTAFAHGQGMPPALGALAQPQPQPQNGNAAPPGQPAQQPQQPQQNQPPQQQNQHMPPTNHPAAVVQRNATKAVAQLMKH